VRALARALGRDVKRVHADASAMIGIGMIEKTPEGKLMVPFAEIRADFVMRPAA
jgi:predicted transcriptional regulator